jgi:hypothetical protein
VAAQVPGQGRLDFAGHHPFDPGGLGFHQGHDPDGRPPVRLVVTTAV